MLIAKTESAGGAGATPRGIAQRSPGIDCARLLDGVARWWFPALVASYLFRLWYGSWRELVPDEAVYWAWSRHLDWSYFDHPPMVALLIRLSTSIFGTSEIGTRAPSATLAFAAALILIRISQQMFSDSRTSALVALIWLTSPLLMVLGMVSTPDTPALFFSIGAMATALAMARRESAQIGLWLLFGLLCGLALLSKYTTILLPGSIFLALLTSRAGRHHLRRPGIYLAGVVALMVFSPVIWWNFRHDWISFRFQFGHGLEAKGGNGATMFLEWLGGQALVATPVLFVMTMFVLGKFWREFRALDLQSRMLLWCATVPLIFFGYSGIRSRGEPNWPAFAYFPASILLARYIAQNWSGHRCNWAIIGCIVALAGGVIVQFPEPLWVANIPGSRKLDELVGWREFGRQIDAVARGVPVIANRHQDASEAAFYMPGRPNVWATSVGSRPTSFDYMPGGPDIRSLPRLLFLGSHVEEFCREFNFTAEKTGRIAIRLPDGRTRTREWTMMRSKILPRPASLPAT